MITQVKDRSRGEQGEDKKVGRLLLDMSEFLSEIPKLVGDDIMAPPKPGRTIPHTILDAQAKSSLATALKKIKDAKEELEQIHKVCNTHSIHIVTDLYLTKKNLQAYVNENELIFF